MVEAVYRILTEETGSMPLNLSRRAKKKEERARMKRRESEQSAHGAAVEEVNEKKTESNGLRQLYRGLGIGVSAQAIVFLLTLVTGSRDSATSWSEM